MSMAGHRDPLMAGPVGDQYGEPPVRCWLVIVSALTSAAQQDNAVWSVVIAMWSVSYSVPVTNDDRVLIIIKFS